MKTRKNINLKIFNGLGQFIVNNKILLLFIMCFIFGFYFGLFGIDKYKFFINICEKYLVGYIGNRIDSGFFTIFINSLLHCMLFVVIEFSFGASMLGVVFIPFFIFLIGGFYGGVSGYLYSEYFLKGIAFNSVLLLPWSVIFIVGIIFAAKDSFEFSYLLSRLTFTQSANCNLSYDFRIYCGRYLIFLSVFTASSLVDGFLSYNFLNSFNVLNL